MREIILTQGKVALVDDEDYDFLSQWKWSAKEDHRTWYAQRMERVGEMVEGRLRQRILMHRVVLARKLGRELLRLELVDHVSSNGLDNCRGNLRTANHSQNNMSKRLQCNSFTGFPGVSLHKCGKFQATIRVNGLKKYLGLFSSAEVAYEVYLGEAKKYFGEYVRLNPSEVTV